MTKERKAQLLTVGLSLSTIGLWFFGPTAPLMLPFLYLNTHVHEFMHALASLGTGGGVISVQVFADSSGITYTQGGFPVIIASAGYLGSTLLGVLLMLASAKEKTAQPTLWIFAISMGLMMLLWLRGDSVGLASGVGWLVALLAAAKFLKPKAKQWVLLFIGTQLAFTSLTTFRHLFVGAMNGHPSDAQNMQMLTGISGMFWSVLWAGLSLVAVGFGLQRLIKAAPASKSAETPLN